MADKNEGVGVQLAIGVDEKQEKKTTASIDKIIGLISDLAIIGKVAGEALGKMWNGLQKTIEASIKDFGAVDMGLTLGVDPEELNALKYAVSQIGGEGKDVMSMLSEMDKVVQSFRNPATGEKEMAKFFGDLARYEVSGDVTDAIREAIEGEDIVEALKLFGDLRNELGSEFSNLMVQRGLDSLARLENPQQYEDWLNAWDKAGSRLLEVNEEGLNDLQDGWADIKFAMERLVSYFGGETGSSIKLLGDAIMTASTNIMEWADQFKASDMGKRRLNNAKGNIENLGALISGDKGFKEFMKDGWELTKDLARINMDADVIRAVKRNPEVYAEKGYYVTKAGRLITPDTDRSTIAIGELNVYADKVDNVEDLESSIVNSGMNQVTSVVQ